VPIINDILCKVTVGVNVASAEKGLKIVRSTYNVRWEKTYAWLVHENGRMFCKVCIATKKDNVFAKDGAG
jgi:hypothetical protein